MVTGGLGYTGSYLVKELVNQDLKVVILDVMEDTRMLDCHRIKDKVKVVNGSVAVLDIVLRIVRDYSVESIYHVAAVQPLTSEREPLKAFKCNIEGTANVVEAARLMDVEKVVCASSTAVYGESSKPNFADEDYPKKPKRVYDYSKFCLELIGESYYKNYGVDFNAARFHTIYGPAMHFLLSILNRFFENPTDTKIKIPYKLEDYTNWLFVEDAAKSLILMNKHKKPNSLFYNIAGETHKVRDFFAHTKKLIPELAVAFEPPGIPNRPWLLDISRAKDELGYEPTPIDETLENADVEYKRWKALFPDKIISEHGYWR